MPPKARNGFTQHAAPGAAPCSSRTCAIGRRSNAHSAAPRLNGLASFRGFLPRALSNACPQARVGPSSAWGRGRRRTKLNISGHREPFPEPAVRCDTAAPRRARAMCELPRQAPFLAFVPQSPLPAVPDAGPGGLANQRRSRTLQQDVEGAGDPRLHLQECRGSPRRSDRLQRPLQSSLASRKTRLHAALRSPSG